MDTRPDSLAGSASPLADFVPIVPEHELIRRIGAGSYGEVWLARSAVGTYRAVKVVYRKTFEHDRPYEREFGGMQKFEPVSRTHAGLVNVLQIGRNDQAGYFYYIMELADDASAERSSAPINPATYKPKTLGEVARHGRLSLDQCVQIILGVTSSLAHLHRHGLVHRDIKPSNILIIHGVPKLADIGLVAGIKETRSFVGTEGFIAPEGPGKPQADIYSLGKVLYEISTGKDRHDFPDLPADLRDSVDQSGFSEMNEIILKACASDVAQRYGSAEEMQADLSILQEGKSVKQKRVSERRWALTKRVGFSTVVLAALVGVLLPLQRQWKAQRPMDPKALGLYTDGQAYLGKGTAKDMDVALPLLEQALALDPNHPKIHAALAWAYEMKFFFYTPTNRELDVKAGHALDRARQLGPNLPETHFANGFMLWYRPDGKGWQHEPAITSFRRVFEANPRLAEEDPMLAAATHQHLVGVYLHIGLMDEALEASKKALEIDSVQSRPHYNRGLVALHRGDYQQAEREFRQGDVMHVGINYANLALACFKQGKADEAKTIIEKALKDSPTDPGGQFASVEAMLFARVGDFTRAKEAIQKAEQSGKGYGHFHHTAYNIGCACALMNQPEEAVRWLRTAADAGFPCYPAFQNDPTLANIRSDPQFQKFLDDQKILWLGRQEFQRQFDPKSRERPIKPEALGLYTDGWALLRKGGKQDFEAATSKLEQALVLDPAHPKIYALLGLAYGKRAFFFEPTNQELESKAEAAADKASSLGPNLPETLFTRGYLLSFRPFNKGWRYQESIESFQRILALHPNLDREDLALTVETHYQLSSIYLHIGLLDEALREAQIADTLEPLHSRAQFLIGDVVLYRGDYREAVKRLQRVIAADAGGNYVDLALAYLNQGLTNEARASVQEGLLKQPSDPGGQYASLEAMLFARAGEFAKAEEAIRIADQRGVGHGQFHHTAYSIACAYALMNKPKPAVEWLQRAVKTGFPCYPLFRDDRTLENIRSAPEFQKFLAEQEALWTGYREFHRQLLAKSRM